MNANASAMRSSGCAQLSRRKPRAGIAETLATEARHAARVVRALQQIQREAVRRDAEPVADGRDRGEHVERPAGHQARDAVDLVQPGDEQLDLLPELLHLRVAIAELVAHGGDARHLRERRHARQRAVRELAEHVDDLRAADGKSEPPAAHAERLAERVGRHGLLDHAGHFEQRMVAAAPDHSVVRLVAEDRDVLAPHELGEPFQIVERRDAAGRIVRAVEKDGPRRLVVGEESPHVVQVRPEIVRRLQLRHHDARVAPEDVRRIGREVRAEDQHAVAGIQKRLAEQLLEVLRARSRDDVFACDR